ncbi:hypothetical protein L484_018597 [Morus notabilis]|uniref:Uncharacterized protein n=1 Tax=Morus notabilis TaxID=981085 RepID=W9R763_9ROSA|nr:hypothetical protein L484_018597 [Morus notabilis]
MDSLARCVGNLRAAKFGNIPKRALGASTGEKERELDRLLALEEYYWKQRARTEWLKEIVEVLENYFIDIFSTSLPDEDCFDAALEGVDRRVSAEVSAKLDDRCVYR